MDKELNLRQVKLNMIQWLRERGTLKVPEIVLLFKSNNIIVSDRLIRKCRSEINKEVVYWRCGIGFKTDGKIEERGYFLLTSVEEVDAYDTKLKALEDDYRFQRQDLKQLKYELFKRRKEDIKFQPVMFEGFGIEEQRIK